MPVIAMTQEMGSLAKDVALELGRAGKLTVLRHEVLENVAGKMRVPTSLISRLREGKAGIVERRRADPERVAVYTAKEVFELAAKGNVVVRGWGATLLLRPVPHVVTVRITRSFDARVAWLMDHLGADDIEFARAEVRRSDTAHAARPEFKETEASRAALAKLALEAAVRAALKENESTSETNVDIDAREGKVTLRGIVLNAQESAEAERVASTVAGVGKVENELRLMTISRKFAYSKT